MAARRLGAWVMAADVPYRCSCCIPHVCRTEPWRPRSVAVSKQAQQLGRQGGSGSGSGRLLSEYLAPCGPTAEDALALKVGIQVIAAVSVPCLLERAGLCCR